MRPKIEMVGKTFGKVTVLAEAGRHSERIKKLTYICVCACGKEFRTLGVNLRNGGTTSCGCNHGGRVKHGNALVGATTPEYRTWLNIKARCYNSSVGGYENYGGRGIYVCDEWKDSFETFLADMGPRPSPEHSIEREENDGPYSKANCKWATRVEQSNNRRSNRLVTLRGETKSLSDWTQTIGISYWVAHSRLKRGWSVEDALLIPAHAKPPSRWLTPEAVKAIVDRAAAGEAVKVLAAEFGVHPKSIYNVLYRERRKSAA